MSYFKGLHFWVGLIIMVGSRISHELDTIGILYLLIMLLCLSADFASLSLMTINSPQHNPHLSLSIFLQTHIYLSSIFTINTHIPFKVITTQKGRMSNTKLSKLLMLLLTLILAAKVIQGHSNVILSYLNFFLLFS